MQDRIVIKVGSNVLAGSDGTLNKEAMSLLVYQIAKLQKNNTRVILVSSGAVAAGKGVVGEIKGNDVISNRQLWSSVGQVNLINTYSALLEIYSLHCAQILVTKEDFRDRLHYLNLRNCIDTLLNQKIIPIINENDAISVTELMFTDNDELSGLIASMVNAKGLFILSNVDGVFSGDPNENGSRLIKTLKAGDKKVSEFIQVKKSSFGRGGMLTKLNIAKKVAKNGIDVFIANGLKENIILDIIAKKENTDFTHIIADTQSSTIKKWIAHSDEFTKGAIYINDGACSAVLSDKATSILPVGVTSVSGEFKKGDLIKVYNSTQAQVGIGRAMYDSETAKFLLGKKGEKPIIHYDYLYLNN